MPGIENGARIDDDRAGRHVLASAADIGAGGDQDADGDRAANPRTSLFDNRTGDPGGNGGAGEQTNGLTGLERQRPVVPGGQAPGHGERCGGWPIEIVVMEAVAIDGGVVERRQSSRGLGGRGENTPDRLRHRQRFHLAHRSGESEDLRECRIDRDEDPRRGGAVVFLNLRQQGPVPFNADRRRPAGNRSNSPAQRLYSWDLKERCSTLPGIREILRMAPQVCL